MKKPVGVRWATAWLAVMALACSADGTGPSGGGGGGGDGGAGAMDAGGGGGPTDAGVGARDVVVPPTDAACERVNVSAEPDPANVLIVLDASGSMYDVALGGEDRWTPAVAAIDAATAALEDRLHFGLMLFPGEGADQCGAGTVRVPVGPMNASAIASELGGDPAALTGGGTPIATSLTAAQTALSSLEGDSYVLLVTDGAPNCNDALSGLSCTCTGPSCLLNNLNCLDDVRTIDAVETLAAAGIGTYVIGYDTGGWASVLDAMAAAGGTGRTTHFPVGDGASLESALRDIGGSVVSCTYELESPPGDIRYVRVTVDGVDVDHESVSGDGNGWRLEGDRTVTLIGDDCDALKDGEAHDIGIVVECEPVII